MRPASQFESETPVVDPSGIPTWYVNVQTSHLQAVFLSKHRVKKFQCVVSLKRLFSSKLQRDRETFVFAKNQSNISK